MSLDVSLVIEGEGKPKQQIFIREDGQNKEISQMEWQEKYPEIKPIIIDTPTNNVVFEYNITHNLGKMADAVNLYKFLWRPDELGISQASDLICPLTIGLVMLKTNQEELELYHSPKNGWGTYEGLVKFVTEYLYACIEYPNSTIEISR